ncbi:hypothetical protein Bca101_057595 [Brassica carinata]
MCLHESSQEAEVLRLENTQLRLMNHNLKKELDQLIRSFIKNQVSYDIIFLRMLTNLSIGGNYDAGKAENQNSAHI